MTISREILRSKLDESLPYRRADSPAVTCGFPPSRGKRSRSSACGAAARPHKYRARGEPIHLVGVEISRETRNVTAFEVADG